MNYPLALQGMVFTVWLIAKGVNSSAVAAGSAKVHLGTQPF
jgi:hypothetical protein